MVSMRDMSMLVKAHEQTERQYSCTYITNAPRPSFVEWTFRGSFLSRLETKLKVNNGREITKCTF